MIRKLTPSDCETYITMADEFYHSTAVSHPIPRENIAAAFEHMINDGTYMQGFIFEENGSPAGFCTVALTYSQEAGGIVLWIEDLYILEAYRGKGIGTRFFSFLKSEFPDAVRWRLEITENNSSAKRLYERTGFEVSPYISMMYENPN